MGRKKNKKGLTNDAKRTIVRNDTVKELMIRSFVPKNAQGQVEMRRKRTVSKI